MHPDLLCHTHPVTGRQWRPLMAVGIQPCHQNKCHKQSETSSLALALNNTKLVWLVRSAIFPTLCPACRQPWRCT